MISSLLLLLQNLYLQRDRIVIFQTKQVSNYTVLLPNTPLKKADTY